MIEAAGRQTAHERSRIAPFTVSLVSLPPYE
jgi:hypothetical protein